LLVSDCGCRLRADSGDQPRTAASVPRGHRREPPVFLIGLVIAAVLKVPAVPRMRRKL